MKDGVAIIRIDGPQKMNVIDDNFRQEMETLWTVRVLYNIREKLSCKLLFSSNSYFHIFRVSLSILPVFKGFSVIDVFFNIINYFSFSFLGLFRRKSRAILL